MNLDASEADLFNKLHAIDDSMISKGGLHHREFLREAGKGQAE